MVNIFVGSSKNQYEIQLMVKLFFFLYPLEKCLKFTCLQAVTEYQFEGLLSKSEGRFSPNFWGSVRQKHTQKKTSSSKI